MLVRGGELRVFLLHLVPLVLIYFLLGDLSIDESGVLKSPTIIVLLSISPFRSVYIYFIYLGAPILGT